MKNLTLLILLLAIAPVFSWGQCASCVLDTASCPVPSGLGGGELQICGDTFFIAGVTDTVFKSFTWIMPTSFIIRQGDPIIPGFPVPSPFDLANNIERVILNDVTGLPAGLTWECDSAANNCDYEPFRTPYACIAVCGVLGCETAGTYNVEMHFTTVTSTDISSLDPTFAALLQSFGGNLDSQVANITIPLTFTIEPGTNLLLDITIPGSSTVIDSGQAITLNATTGFDIYNWSSGETGSSINAMPTDTTTYVVTATDSLGCSQLDSIEVQVTKVVDIDTSGNVGIFEPLVAEIRIYPNPNQGKFSIELPTNEKDVVSLQVIAIDGSVLYQLNELSGRLVEINTNSLAAGLYLIKLETAQGIYWTKTIIE